MGFFGIVLIFLCFCVLWVGTNIVWKILEGRLMTKMMEQRMDAAYAKMVRLVLRAAQEWKLFGKDVKPRDD